MITYLSALTKVFTILYRFAYIVLLLLALLKRKLFKPNNVYQLR